MVTFPNTTLSIIVVVVVVVVLGKVVLLVVVTVTADFTVSINTYIQRYLSY